MSTIKVSEAEVQGWRCEPCGEDMVPAPAELEYLDSLFNVELPTCPKCGYILIPEPLALGKMYQVEQMLEDK